MYQVSPQVNYTDLISNNEDGLSSRQNNRMQSKIIQQPNFLANEAKSKIMYSLVPHPMTAAAHQFSREKMKEGKGLATAGTNIRNTLLRTQKSNLEPHPLLNTKLQSTIMLRPSDSPNTTRQKSPRLGTSPQLSQKQRLRKMFLKTEGSDDENDSVKMFTPRTGSLIPTLGNPNLTFMKNRMLSQNILQNQQSIQSGSIAQFQSVHYTPQSLLGSILNPSIDSTSKKTPTQTIFSPK